MLRAFAFAVCLGLFIAPTVRSDDDSGPKVGEKAFDKHKEYLPKIATALSFEKTQLAAFDGAKSGPDGWAINGDTHVTAVVVNKGKVAKSFAFVSVNDTDVKGVIEELKKAMK